MNNFKDYFITKTRSNGQSYTCLTDDRPEVLYDFVYQVHREYFFGALPNDWVYQTIAEAFDDLANDKLEDCNIEADVYDHMALQWLRDYGHAFAIEYCNEWLNEFCDNQANDIVAAIKGGQWLARDRIYNVVSYFIEEQGGQDE